MATRTAPEKRRARDYSPDIETGDLLESIEGEEVEVASVEFATRNGAEGPYTLTVLSLGDGRRVHTSSPIVKEVMEAIPVDDFPVWATFARQASQSTKGRTYWTVK